MLLVEAIALGMGLNFFYYEVFGIVAGGLVTPGYFALAWDRPLLAGATVAWAFLSMVTVRVLAAHTILYGRRRFMLTILVGFACQWAAESFLYGFEVGASRMEGIGYIIPGLLAHEMERQGIVPTLLALLSVSATVRILLVSFGYLSSW